MIDPELAEFVENLSDEQADALLVMARAFERGDRTLAEAFGAWLRRAHHDGDDAFDAFDPGIAERLGAACDRSERIRWARLAARLAETGDRPGMEWLMALMQRRAAN